MRITNQMMTNNSLNSISKNKQNLSRLEEQYYTGKKIQRPSDDPVIAIRALKLRSNLTELNQYYERNIPDARSWMDVTEGAMQKVTDILSSIHTYCVQGSQDTLTQENRKNIAETLEQYKSQIFQEGNADFAGRYIFTGFKTNTSLTFLGEQDNVKYTITEDLDKTSLETIKKVTGGYHADDYDGTQTVESYEANPVISEAYRLRLSYRDLDNVVPEITYIDADGEEQTITLTGEAYNEVSGEIENFTSLHPSAYKPEDGEANFIANTGEIVLSQKVYDELLNAKSIHITYQKTDFSKGEMRPEHYFSCTAEELDEEGEVKNTIVYEKENQEIKYEVSFNQMLTINTQARDAFPADIAREIDEILYSIEEVQKVETEIEKAKKILDGTSSSDTETIETVTRLKEQLEAELSLRNSVMQKQFENSLDRVVGYQRQVNAAIADLGSRYTRLDLAESRLSSQQNDFEDLLSTNEDADMVETIIRFNSQEVIYNASLSASARVVQNTLMDFLR